MNFPGLITLQTCAKTLAACWTNGWKRAPVPCWPAGSSNSASGLCMPRRSLRKGLPPRRLPAPRRILRPIISLPNLRCAGARRSSGRSAGASPTGWRPSTTVCLRCAICSGSAPAAPPSALSRHHRAGRCALSQDRARISCARSPHPAQPASLASLHLRLVALIFFRRRTEVGRFAVTHAVDRQAVTQEREHTHSPGGIAAVLVMV
jgi:hypothetical protein